MVLKKFINIPYLKKENIIVNDKKIVLLDTIFKIAALLINFLAAYVLYEYSDILESITRDTVMKILLENN